MNYTQLLSLESQLLKLEKELMDSGDVTDAWSMRHAHKTVSKKMAEALSAEQGADQILRKIQAEL